MTPRPNRGSGVNRIPRRSKVTTKTLVVVFMVALAASAGAQPATIFSDGFELGDTSGWNNETPWLQTEGNKIWTGGGVVWHGRGANIHDTRSCWACSWAPPNVDEVKRRIDTLVDDWNAGFLRLLLESYLDNSGGQVQWQGVLDDPDYLQSLVEIVEHIGTKPGVYVMVSLWADPTFSDLGWPTADTIAVWERLAETFAGYPHVIYGLVNEPEENWNGALDEACWTAMNDTVAAIRAVETAIGAHHHVIAVQGTRAWARVLDYYITHPITAGGGVNIAYETHVYNPASDFDALFVTPSQTLPVIIGEFGVVSGMTAEDCGLLMDQAEALQIPYTAWTFHMRCPPNLIEDSSGGGCGVGMDLTPTSWGVQLRDQLDGGSP